MDEKRQADDEGYGVVTVGYGSSQQQELKIVDYVRSSYKDHRVASCCLIEDGTFLISVENLQSSGRNPTNNMRLSKESFAALLSNCILYMNIKGMDVESMVRESMNGENIGYHFSDNLKDNPFTKNLESES